MRDSIYALGKSGIYFTDTGLFAAEPQANDTVVELNGSNLHLFEPIYAGTLIQNLDAYKTLLDESEFKLPEELKEGLELIEIFDDFFEVAKKLNEWVSRHPSQPDPMMLRLQQIHEDLRRIADFQLAAWVSQMEDNLALLMARSTTALLTLQGFLASGKPASDPEWAPRLALAERDSLEATQTFVRGIEHGFWKRPYSVKALSRPGRGVFGDPTSYSYGWMPHMTDRAEEDDFGRVWDYRWALPALTYAVSCRVAVIRGLGGVTAVERDEIKNYINVLGDVFKKMQSGVRKIRVPSEAEIARMWAGSQGVPVAAVDIYGGHFYASSFYRFYRREFFDAPIPPKGLWFESIYPDTSLAQQNVDRIGRWWWNIVCRKIGLPELLMYIGGLENVINEPDIAPSGINKALATYTHLTRDERASAAAKLVSGLATLIEPDSNRLNPERVFGMYQTLNHAEVGRSEWLKSIAAELEALSS